MDTIPGECFCGCGHKTNIIKHNRADRGLKKGEYYKFIKGHQFNLTRKNVIADYARKNGYCSEKSMVKAMVQEHGEYEAVAKTIGVTCEWIGKLARKYKVELKTKNQQQVEQKRINSDCRPSNLAGPWADLKQSPCKICKFTKRDKNAFGCEKCPLPAQYIRLIEKNVYTGVSAR